MSTPLENEIYDEFKKLVTTSEAISDELAQKVMELFLNKDAPNSAALFEMITANVGENPL